MSMSDDVIELLPIPRKTRLRLVEIQWLVPHFHGCLTRVKMIGLPRWRLEYSISLTTDVLSASLNAWKFPVESIAWPAFKSEYQWSSARSSDDLLMDTTPSGPRDDYFVKKVVLIPVFPAIFRRNYEHKWKENSRLSYRSIERRSRRFTPIGDVWHQSEQSFSSCTHIHWFNCTLSSMLPWVGQSMFQWECCALVDAILDCWVNIW